MNNFSNRERREKLVEHENYFKGIFSIDTINYESLLIRRNCDSCNEFLAKKGHVLFIGVVGYDG